NSTISFHIPGITWTIERVALREMRMRVLKLSREFRAKRKFYSRPPPEAAHLLDRPSRRWRNSFNESQRTFAHALVCASTPHTFSRPATIWSPITKEYSPASTTQLDCAVFE